MSKNNVSYYIAGALATLTLLASGVFAAAPYIGFLAPVAALSVGLPFIIGCAVFSIVTIALSYKAISKNKTISEKDVQLADEKSKVDKIISERDAQLAKQAEEIKSKDIQLAGEKSKVEAKDKTISKKDALLIEKNKKIEEDKLKVAIADGTVQLAKGILDSVGSGMNKVYNAMPSIESAKEKLSNAFDAVGNGLRNTYSVMPSVKFAKDIQTASQKAFASVNEAYSSGRVPGIVKRGLTDVYYPPIESAKETISSVGDKLKNVYGTSVGYTKKILYSVEDTPEPDTTPTSENQLANQVLSKSQDKSSKSSGSKFKLKHAVLGSVVLAAPVLDSVLELTAGNSFNAIGNPINGTKGGVPILTSVCPRLTTQYQIDEYSNKLKNAENNFGIPKEGSPSSEGIFSSIYNKVSSAVSSVWGSLGNLASGSNKGAHYRSEPQWYKDLYKSETMEEIMDGGILGNLFSPRVDNGINTSKQQGTFIDSVELKRLTKELSPSAYPNGSPRAL